MPEFSQTAESVADGPSENEVAEVVRFSLSLIAFFREAQRDPTAPRPTVPAVPSGIKLPDPICRAFLARVPLSRLEAAGICSVSYTHLNLSEHRAIAVHH